MKLYKGSILTCDSENTVARYLVEDKGFIIYIGNELPIEYADIETINLGKKALMPSFVDTHIHFACFAMFHAGLNVMSARSNTEIMKMLSNFSSSWKGKILIGFGASSYSVVEKRLISRTELDTVCSHIPVMIVKYDGHSCIINSALMSLIKNKIENLCGFHEFSGEMNQEAFFAVFDYVANSIPFLEFVSNMQKAVDYIASKGIGMIHSASGIGFSKDLDVAIERFVARGVQHGFKIRLFFQTMDIKKTRRRHLPRIGGCFATALDGCFCSKDASLTVPYENSDSNGILYYTDEQVTEFCKNANRAGLQIEIHAIGDAAFDQATKALKAALDDFPRKDHRHGIIHACLPTKEGLEICRDYHIQILLQTSFINRPQEPDEYLSEILGSDRTEKLNPLHTFAEYGIPVSAGSDAPYTDPDPILWIHNACNHSIKEQSLSVYEALRMCTYNGCRASFDEDKYGSLEDGKKADMVILSENPYAVPVENLKNLKVEQLVLSGKNYLPQTGSCVALLLKGVFPWKKC